MQNRTVRIMDKKESFLEGLKDGIPIGTVYFTASLAFGIAAISSGLNFWEAGFISLTNLTSAGQFAALGVIAGSGSYFEMMLTQLIINLRYMLMSLSLSQKLDDEEPRKHRFLVAFGITDEIFAISIKKKGKVSAFYNYGAMSVAIPGWVLGTVTGAVLGNILPDMILSALSIAIYAMFIGIIIPPAKADKNLYYIIIAAMVLSLLFGILPVLKDISSGFTIIIITVVVSAAAAILFPVSEGEKEAM